MRWSLLALAAISTSPLVMFSLVGIGGAKAPDGFRVSDPIVHENLAIYFIHGKSEAGKVPLTLEEAMAKGFVRVRETSNVNQLEIENLGAEEVFVQSGDIVKGGKQDRTLMVSLVLPPKSGSVPIASFCVEEGRWSPRGREDAAQLLDRLRCRAFARDEACDEGANAGRRSDGQSGHAWRRKLLCGRNRFAPATGMGRRSADAGQAHRSARCVRAFGAIGLQPAACT